MKDFKIETKITPPDKILSYKKEDDKITEATRQRLFKAWQGLNTKGKEDNG